MFNELYMKKLLLTVVAAACIIFAGIAQNKKSKSMDSENKARIEQRAKDKVEAISQEMELTKKQEKELLEHYSAIEAKKKEERQIAQREREKREAERNKELAQQDKELERILGAEKFEEYKQKRERSGEVKKDKVVDNFIDFMGDSFELNPKQREALREYYQNQEKNLKKIIRTIESKQGEVEEILKDQGKKMDDIFKKEKNENMNYVI